MVNEISKSEKTVAVPLVEKMKEVNLDLPLTKLNKAPIYGFDKGSVIPLFQSLITIIPLTLFDTNTVGKRYSNLT